MTGIMLGLLFGFIGGCLMGAWAVLFAWKVMQ
jgi:hypothetical protein